MLYIRFLIVGTSKSTFQTVTCKIKVTRIDNDNQKTNVFNGTKITYRCELPSFLGSATILEFIN